jgi:hypothetical protein
MYVKVLYGYSTLEDLLMKRLAGLVSAVALAFFASACAETDAGVTTKVKAQLAADEMVKAYKVDVDTREHVVTLSGEVETAAVKEQAVRIARSTEGVRDVVDDLRVVGTSGSLDPSVTIDRAEDKVEIKIEDDTDGLGDNIKDGARATGSAVKKGAEATADGAKKAGGAIRDAVTDDDKDSDNDGK